MRKITFTGASDDTIEVEGCGAYDPDHPDHDGSGAEFEVFSIASDGKSVLIELVEADTDAVLGTVVAFYRGWWAFAFVGFVDEDGDYQVVMLDGWTAETRDSDEVGHSMQLTVTIPDDCVVSARIA